MVHEYVLPEFSFWGFLGISCALIRTKNVSGEFKKNVYFVLGKKLLLFIYLLD